MVLYIIIGLWDEFKSVKVFDFTTLQSCTDCLFTFGTATCHYFYMDYVVFLRSNVLIIILAWVKNKITWLHVFEFNIDWKCVILIRLIPQIQLKPKLIPHDKHNLSHQPRTIQIQRSIIVFTSFFLPVLCHIRHTEIGFGSVDETFTKVLLKSWILPVSESNLFRHT